MTNLATSQGVSFADRYNRGQREYWHPRPPQVGFQLRNVVSAEQRSLAAKLGWTLVGLLAIPFEKTLSATTKALSINAYPPDGWRVPVNAPKLPQPIKPRGKDGQEDSFDEGKQSAVQEINRDDASRVNPGDAYDRHRQGAQAKPEKPQAEGDQASEAQLRYEHNARLRMTARRGDDKEIAAQADQLQAGEALPTKFGDWAEKTRFQFLTRGQDQNATDHSTILTNAYHAEHVMAYDLPIGYCSFAATDWAQLRMAADWRWCGEMKVSKEIAAYSEYFDRGKFGDKYPHGHPDYQPSQAAALGMDVTRARNGPSDPWPNNQPSSGLPHDFGS